MHRLLLPFTLFLGACVEQADTQPVRVPSEQDQLDQTEAKDARASLVLQGGITRIMPNPKITWTMFAGKLQDPSNGVVCYFLASRDDGNQMQCFAPSNLQPAQPGTH